jgi:hypothetical protein
MERETWEALLSFLLAINDALLSPPTVKGNGARDRRSSFSFKQCFESRFFWSGSRLCWILIQALAESWFRLLLNPDSGFSEPDLGFAESGFRLCWILIKALLFPDPGFSEPDLGFAESGSMLCWIRIQALLKPDSGFAKADSGFAKAGFRLYWIRI